VTDCTIGVPTKQLGKINPQHRHMTQKYRRRQLILQVEYVISDVV